MSDLDELDRLAAEKVMGWDRLPFGEWCPGNPKGRHVWPVNPMEWQPTRDIAQAWLLQEKIVSELKGASFEVALMMSGKWTCAFWQLGLDKLVAISNADTAPEAIVKAALRAKGIEMP